MVKPITRVTIATFLALCFLGGQVSADTDIGYATSDATWRHHACRFQSASPRHWTGWEVRSTVGCASDTWHVPFAVLASIIERESGWFPGAVNPTSGACGLMQYYPASTFQSFWVHLARLHGQPAGPSCFNARSNVLAGAHYISNNGTGPWS